MLLLFVICNHVINARSDKYTLKIHHGNVRIY